MDEEVKRRKIQEIVRRGTELSVSSASSVEKKTDEDFICDIDMDPQSETGHSSTVSLQRHFINARLVGVLDRCKISDRSACHVITAVAVALGNSLNDLIISRSSIRRCR